MFRLRSTPLAISFVLLGVAGCARQPQHSSRLRLGDGAELALLTIGSGSDTVVVLHGGPGLQSRYLVEPLAPLARGRTLIFYDMRGRGRSSPVTDSTRLGMECDLADLDSVRSRLGLRRMTLVAHGYGAAVAARYAVAHPDRVRRMLWLSPLFPRVLFYWAIARFEYGGADTLGLEGIAAARVAGLDTADSRAFCLRYWGAYLSPAPVRDRATTRRLASVMCDADPTVLRRTEWTNRQVMRSLGDYDLRPLAAEVRAPTLIVQGIGVRRDSMSDGRVWRDAAIEWARALPEGHLIVLHAAHHFPWLEEPRRFRRASQTFLGGAWPSDTLPRGL